MFAITPFQGNFTFVQLFLPMEVVTQAWNCNCYAEETDNFPFITCSTILAVFAGLFLLRKTCKFSKITIKNISCICSIFPFGINFWSVCSSMDIFKLINVEDSSLVYHYVTIIQVVHFKFLYVQNKKYNMVFK